MSIIYIIICIASVVLYFQGYLYLIIDISE